MVQHNGSSEQDPGHFYTPTDAPLTLFEKHIEIGANTRVRVSMGARQDRNKGVKSAEWSTQTVDHTNRDAEDLEC